MNEALLSAICIWARETEQCCARYAEDASAARGAAPTSLLAADLARQFHDVVQLLERALWEAARERRIDERL